MNGWRDEWKESEMYFIQCKICLILQFLNLSDTTIPPLLPLYFQTFWHLFLISSKDKFLRQLLLLDFVQ